MALAWPATVLIFFFLIRKELPGVAKAIRRFRYKDVELEFGEAAKEIAGETKEAVPITQENIQLSGRTKSEAQARLEEIADLAPRAAILEAWLSVEAAAADLLRKKGFNKQPAYPGPLRLLKSLQEEGFLDRRQVAVFEGLRTLRNEAVHTPDAEFTKVSVLNYIESAVSMASYLESKAADS